MVSRSEFNELERRVDAIEKTLAEIQTLVKILRPIAILLGASVGIDVHGFLM
jgi:tetrahydromethanopterin S-methyltransferase subunit G